MPKKTPVAKKAVAVKSNPDKPAAAKPTSKSAPKQTGQTKTNFVLAQPASMAAKDVVAAAKSKGFVLSEGYVYTIRSAARQKGKSKPAAGASAAKKPGAPKPKAAAKKLAPKKSAAKKAAPKKAGKKAAVALRVSAPKARKALPKAAKKIRIGKPSKPVAARAGKPTGDAFSELAPLDLAYAVGRLVESGKTTAADVLLLAAERTARISSLETELEALRGGLVPATPAGQPGKAASAKAVVAKAAPKKGAKTSPKKVGTVSTRRDGRTFTTTPKVVAARKYQGQYMGYLRQFPEKDKERFKAIAREQGVPAAIAELKKELGKV